jgi:acetyl-CoA acetyltransferase family protein
MESVYIVSAVRSPLGKAGKGSFANMRIDDLAAEVVKAAIAQVPGLNPNMIEDVMLGCAMPEGEQGLNIARNVSFLAGIPVSSAAVTINRFCASSLESVMQASRAIMCGDGDIFVTGGVESMSHVPMGGFNPSLNEKLMMPGAPSAYIGMGETAEILAEKYGISRGEQDQFALSSHVKAVRAIKEGYFKQEIVPVGISADEGPREDTSLEKLAALKPAFKANGTVTAGNSSQMTDGAAVVILMSKSRAKKLGIKPVAKIISMAVAGCDPATMGEGPIFAVPKALNRAGMKLKNIDLVELNEAFASQSLSVVKALSLDPARLNVHGGAIALGHPLGASGARLVATMIGAMRAHNKKTGLVTLCVGGGQGAALVLERMS